MLDTTCVPYIANDLQCNALAVCETYHSTENSFTPPGVCEHVTRYNKNGLSEYGSTFYGTANMKREINTGGPISYGISLTK